MKNKLVKKVLATGAALCLSALALTPATAWAQTPPGNIDTTKTTSITVHKHTAGDGTQGKADGSGTAGSKPLAGVTFTAYKLTNINLETNYADWDKLAEIQKAYPKGLPANACSAAELATPTWVKNTGIGLDSTGKKLDPTAADGTAKLDNTGIAAYLFCETERPANVTVPAIPFIVTAPYPGEGTNPSWIYDVHAYPKNEVGEVKKTNKTPEELGLGSKATFEVSTKVPNLPEGYTTFKHFVFSDTLDDRLKPGYPATNSTTPAVNNVYIPAAGSEPRIDFAPTTDYTLTVDGQKVTVEFTKTGIAKLVARKGETIYLDFNATITSIGNGVVENKAHFSVDPNKDYDPNEPGNPSNKVIRKYGDLKLLKYGEATESNVLKGAKFQVFEAADPYASDCKGATKKSGADAIKVNGVDTFTSDEKGLVKIDGLFVSAKSVSIDAQGNRTEVGNENDQRCYVVEEIEPPVGYVKIADPIGVAVKKGLTDAGSYDLKVDNSKQIVPGLPLTGAQGKLILQVGGVALVAGAICWVFVARRRNAIAA